jgi:DNA-binding PadR family transcriptional regulator
MSTARGLTTTSFAVLGLLAIKPWTTYDLIRQVDRSLRRFWPRAQSKLYEEPKKLVALGLAEAAEERVGKRRRTWYSITPAGRQALAAWLAEPGAGPSLEFEQLVKIHLADRSTRTAVRAGLAATLAWVAAQNEENLAVARAYLAGGGEFPERTAVNQLVGRFLTDYYAMVTNWANWAIETVDAWPDDPARATPDPASLAETVRRAERLAVELGAQDRSGIEKSGSRRRG